MQNKNYKKEIPYEFSDYALEKFFKETGKRQGWLPENGSTAFIAVSGGGDSIALLWLFYKFYSGRVIALHINHGLRANESDEDQNFVDSFTSSLKLFLATKRVKVPVDKLPGESIEAAARRLRLQGLCELVRIFDVNNGGNRAVFLGHNRDDLAETVLFNILRGSGIRGSVGITESSEFNGVKFYRPLLEKRRKFLRDMLLARGVPWREDSSNLDSKYTRNFIRLELLPLIERKINSSAVEHLANFGEDMRPVRLSEEQLSVEFFRECLDDISSPEIIFSRRKLKAKTNEEISLIIRYAGRKLNLPTLSRDRCQELIRLIRSSRSFIFQWAGNVEVKSKDGKIFLG